jgi:hypothetical protein
LICEQRTHRSCVLQWHSSHGHSGVQLRSPLTVGTHHALQLAPKSWMQSWPSGTCRCSKCGHMQDAHMSRLSVSLSPLLITQCICTVCSDLNPPVKTEKKARWVQRTQMSQRSSQNTRQRHSWPLLVRLNDRAHARRVNVCHKIKLLPKSR